MQGVSVQGWPLSVLVLSSTCQLIMSTPYVLKSSTGFVGYSGCRGAQGNPAGTQEASVRAASCMETFPVHVPIYQDQAAIWTAPGDHFAVGPDCCEGVAGCLNVPGGRLTPIEALYL